MTLTQASAAAAVDVVDDDTVADVHRHKCSQMHTSKVCRWKVLNALATEMYRKK